jgi:acyl carrier protein
MGRTAGEIEEWIVARVGKLTGVAPGQIDVREPYLRYGLDSVAVVALVADLESWLGIRFRANPLEEHATIASLAQFLAEEAAKQEKRDGA